MRWHPVRDLTEDAKRRPGAADDIEPLGAQHIGDAIAVGQNGRRTARHSEPGKLTQGQHRVFDVDVNIDEVRRNVLAFRIDDPLGVKAPRRRHLGDVAPSDHDVALEDFAGMQCQHLAAANNEIG